MTDNNNSEIQINDSVKHIHRPNYPVGKIVRILDGCNALCWVDFGQLVSNKTHLTICTKYDILKTIK